MRTFATVTWHVDDVLAMADDRGVDISKEQATKFLSEIEEILSEAMIMTGWEVMDWQWYSKMEEDE